MTTPRIIAAVAAALIGLTLSAGPGRSDEDCDKVVENLEDAVQVATKVLELEMAEVTKKKPEDDKEKTVLRNKFCSATGEFLGASRVYRAVANECMRGAKRRDTVSSLDSSIKSLEKSIRDTCG
jgi:hypothetical protein